MDNYEKNYLSKHPDDLCKKCGLCCRVATTTLPYEQLKRMSEEGNAGAIDFLSVFEPYSSTEEARDISEAAVNNVINSLKNLGQYNPKELNFYKCKYLDDGNLCTRYDNRPAFCKHFPSSPWAIVPPGCGYEGWLFLKREETKQKIRKVKEDLLELELLQAKTKSADIQLKIASVVKKMESTIDFYKKFGSANW